MHPTIVLPAAGEGCRLRSQTNKLCTKFVDEERLWEKQQRVISAVFPNSEQVYITGFRADTIDKDIKSDNVTICHNWRFDKTNVAYSINIGLKNTNYEDGVLIVLGDLYFDEKTFENLPVPSGHSYLIYDNKNEFDKKEIGLNIFNGTFDYEFSNKWGQIAYLSAEAVDKFIFYTSKSSSQHKFCFEILNKLNMDNVKFQIVGVSGILIEIDRQKDINKINNIIKSQN
jgi:choline kinase